MQASCFPPAPATVETIFRRHSVFGKEQLEREEAHASLEGSLVWKNRNALLGLPTKLKHLHPEQSHAKHNKQKRLSPTLLGSLLRAHNGFHRICFAITTNWSCPAGMAALLSRDRRIPFLAHCPARALLQTGIPTQGSS